jgi:hypothetical protein
MVVNCVALRRNNSQRELFYFSKGERSNPFAFLLGSAVVAKTRDCS